MRPTECKYCGCRETIATRRNSVTWACRTYWEAHNGGVWVRRSDTCGSQVGDLYKRIRRAIKAIRAANRYYLLGEVALIPDETGNLTQACVLDDIVKILEGVSDDEAK